MSPPARGFLGRLVRRDRQAPPPGPVRVLVVGQTPPPVHGQSVCIEQLLRGPLPGVEVQHLRMAFSGTEAEIGRPSLRKVGHLASLTVRAVRALLRDPGLVLYYPPGASLAPLLRDTVFLCATRALARATVLHFHAGGASDFARENPLLRPLLRLALGRADAAIQLLPSAPADGAFFGARRTYTVPNGVSAPPLPDPVPRDGHLRLLFLGMHTESKGLWLAAESLARLRDLGVEARLRTAGAFTGEDQRAVFERHLRSLGLSEHVECLGVVRGEAKWRELLAADVLVFPSFYRHELMPVAILEAMACGLPVVGTRWGCIPDLVADGETGLLVPPRQVQPLVDALARLADPALRRRLGEAARRRHAEHFTLERHLAAMAGVFHDVGRE